MRQLRHAYSENMWHPNIFKHVSSSNIPSFNLKLLDRLFRLASVIINKQKMMHLTLTLKGIPKMLLLATSHSDQNRNHPTFHKATMVAAENPDRYGTN